MDKFLRIVQDSDSRILDFLYKVLHKVVDHKFLRNFFCILSVCIYMGKGFDKVNTLPRIYRNIINCNIYIHISLDISRRAIHTHLSILNLGSI